MIRLIKIAFYAACLTAIFTLNLYWLWFGIVILIIGTLVEVFINMPSSIVCDSDNEKKKRKSSKEHEIYYHLFLNNKK